MNLRSRRSLVLQFVCVALVCFLSSCGGGSSHSSSSTSTAVTVLPSTATVATNQTQQFTATLNGANTAVSWSVNAVAGGNSTVGTISPNGLYTAPASIPSPATVTVSAAEQATSSIKPGNASVTITNPLNNQQTQAIPIKLGTTGGNVNDFTIQGNIITCCSGTLGSLVSRGGTQFILSNNHVLARSDQAKTGEIISQPGLVDNRCMPGNTVAHLSQPAPLKTSGVDAALAAVVLGAVDPTGSILDLGAGGPAPPAATPEMASVGMTVAKSGRSSGLTCSSVQSINTATQITYQTSCNGGTTFNVKFNNQVVVGGATFSAAGDSGSLIVDSQTAGPVALLYGGSSNTTVGNPIQAVLTALKDPSSGASPTFVGGATHSVACPASSAAAQTSSMLSQQEVQRATVVKARHEVRLMSDPAVIGVGVGASDDNPGEAELVLYVDREKTHVPIPAEIEGVRTKVIVTDRFHATSSQQASANTNQPEQVLSDAEVARGTAAKERHASRLMADPAIFGVGVGRSADDPSQAAVVIYLDKNASRIIPTQLDGVRTKVIRTDRFRAYGWGKQNENRPACSRPTNPER